MTTSIKDITVKTIKGQDKSLSEYEGKVLLIVNVASKCGLTPQYKGLENLYTEFKEEGLRVLGFPCNDFGAQEPGSNDEIQEFCSLNYGVSFDMFDKVHVKGAEQHPLFARLTSAVQPTGDITWNFGKFLVNRNGEVVARFEPTTKPDDPRVLEAIETELAK
jgi:glutathione peroxidase